MSFWRCTRCGNACESGGTIICLKGPCPMELVSANCSVAGGGAASNSPVADYPAAGGGASAYAPSEHTFVAPDGTTRGPHYGSGVQPWDLIKEAGWAAQFAAGNVLKYLRRTKEVEDSRRKAVWYFRELCKLGVVGSNPRCADAAVTLAKLMHLLTHEELALLRSPAAGRQS